MKMKSAVTGFLLVLFFLASNFVTGCATAPPVDWKSRVGHYTYAQAVNELGPPNRQIRLSNGATEFRWFPRQPPSSFGVGGMNQSGANNYGMDNNLGASPGFNDRYLQLTFDANGVLTGWSKNY